MVNFNKLQKTTNGFCDEKQKQVKIHQENANLAQTVTYQKAHQKLQHPGKEVINALVKTLTRINSLKLE
jgi:hypothetical protein